MTDTQFVNLTKDLIKYNYRLNSAERRLYLKTITTIPGALEQSRAFFGDRGSYEVSSADLNRFVRDINSGRKPDSRNYKKKYNKK